LFGAVTWEDFDRGLKFIGEKIQADSQVLVQRAEALEGDAYEQVRVELGVVSAYFLPGAEAEQRVRIEGLEQL